LSMCIKKGGKLPNRGYKFVRGYWADAVVRIRGGGAKGDRRNVEATV